MTVPPVRDELPGVPLLSMRGVSWRTPDGHGILDGVHLEVAPGERVAILGASGSGKSTLLRLALGELPPSVGSISIQGRETASWDLARHLKVVGVVFQQDGLIGDATVLQNILIGPAGEAAGAPEYALELLCRLGLEAELADRKPGMLSGGQRRRVALARCAMAPRALMLFDEPTAGLDPESADEVAQAIIRLSEDPPSGYLIVTHDRLFAERTCSRILHLAHGRLEPLPPVEGAVAPVGPRKPDGGSTGSRSPPAPTPVAVVCRRDPYTAADVLSGQLATYAATAAPLLLGGALVLGFTIVLQSIGAARLPFDRVVDVERPLLEAILRGLLFEVIPLAMGLLYAGVGGASIAGAIATMHALGETDSLRWAGVSPRSFLWRPMTVASVTGAGILLVPCWLAAALGSKWAVDLAPTVMGPEAVPAMIQEVMRDTPGQLSLAAIKVLVFSGLTATIAYGVGASQARGAAGTARRGALAALLASAAVVLLNAVFAMVG